MSLHQPTMASWNDVTQGNQLDKCPACGCSLNRKKMTKHLIDCYERKREHYESIGIIKCPLDPLHILPITFLNHHLEGNCSEAMNLLRKFFQKKGLISDFKSAPPDFKADYPEKYLSQQNKDLLYLLQEDLYGTINDHLESESQAQGPTASQSEDVREDMGPD